MKMHLEMSSGKWRPFWLGLNVLKCYVAAQNDTSYLKMLPYATLTSKKWWIGQDQINLIGLNMTHCHHVITLGYT